MTTVNDIGESDRSPTLTVTAGTVPGVPANVRFTSVCAFADCGVQNSVVLEWDPAIDQGAPVYNYEIVMTKSDGSVETLSVGGVPTSPWANLASPQQTIAATTGTGILQISTFAAGQQWKAKVRAQNSFGYSAFSTETALAYMWTQPGAVVNFQRYGYPDFPNAGEVPDNTGIKLSWDLLVVPDGTTNGRGGDTAANMVYKIYGDQTDGLQNNELASISSPGAPVNWEHTSLTSGETWYYTIRASNQGPFQGPASTPITMKVAARPSKITTASVSSTADEVVVLTWGASPANGGDQIINHVFRNAEVSQWCIEKNTALTHTLQQGSGCAPNQSLNRDTFETWHISAANSVGYSESITCTAQVYGAGSCAGGSDCVSACTDSSDPHAASR